MVGGVLTAYEGWWMECRRRMRTVDDDRQCAFKVYMRPVPAHENRMKDGHSVTWTDGHTANSVDMKRKQVGNCQNCTTGIRKYTIWGLDAHNLDIICIQPSALQVVM